MATEAEEAVYRKVRDERAAKARTDQRRAVMDAIEPGGLLDGIGTYLVVSAGELRSGGDPVEEGKLIDRRADELGGILESIRLWLSDPKRLPL